MKLFIRIVALMVMHSLYSMENNYHTYGSGFNITNIKDIKYGPLITKVLAEHNIKKNNYNETKLVTIRGNMPNCLKNFKVKSKEDLKRDNE